MREWSKLRLGAIEIVFGCACLDLRFNSTRETTFASFVFQRQMNKQFFLKCGTVCYVFNEAEHKGRQRGNKS